MTIAIIIAVYALVGGLTCSVVETIGTRTCKYRICDADCGHRWLAGIALFTWPVALPAYIGFGLGPYIVKERKRLSRAEKRRQSEIEEAQHNIELARLRSQEDEILNRQLTSLRK